MGLNDILVVLELTSLGSDHHFQEIFNLNVSFAVHLRLRVINPLSSSDQHVPGLLNGFGHNARDAICRVSFNRIDDLGSSG